MALQAALKLSTMCRMWKLKVLVILTTITADVLKTQDVKLMLWPRFHDGLRVYTFLQSLRAFQNHAQEAMVLNIVLSWSVYLTAQTKPLLVRFVEGDVQFLFTSSPCLSFCERCESPPGEVLVDGGACAHILPRRKLQSFGIWVWLERVRRYSNPFYPIHFIMFWHVLTFKYTSPKHRWPSGQHASVCLWQNEHQEPYCCLYELCCYVIFAYLYDSCMYERYARTYMK